jgi:RNA polymerase sigma-70 factor (ECF subfamily)
MLVEGIRRGDGAAEAALVERYQRGLLYKLRRMTGNPAAADDLLQETFRIVLARLRERELEEPEKLAGFLLRTARNLFIADYRKRSRRGENLEGPEPEREVSSSPGQLSRVLRREQAEVVRRLLGELPTDRDRQILFRFYLAEDEKDEICADLGLSSLHFNRVLYRARQRFKELVLERSPGLSDTVGVGEVGAAAAAAASRLGSSEGR